MSSAKGPLIRRAWTVVLPAAGVLATAVAASAQEAAASFDMLAQRVQAGQLIWVTDTSGREVRGRLERLSSDGLVLRTNGLQMLGEPDVRRVRARDRDSLGNGTLVGLAIGGGVGTAWCLGAIADDSGNVHAGVECAEGFTVFPALGALVGLAVDAAIPGKMRVVYQASPAHGPSGALLTVAPSFSRGRTKGVTFVFAF